MRDLASGKIDSVDSTRTAAWVRDYFLGQSATFQRARQLHALEYEYTYTVQMIQVVHSSSLSLAHIWPKDCVHIHQTPFTSERVGLGTRLEIPQQWNARSRMHGADLWSEVERASS